MRPATGWKRPEPVAGYFNGHEEETIRRADKPWSSAHFSSPPPAALFLIEIFFLIGSVTAFNRRSFRGLNSLCRTVHGPIGLRAVPWVLKKSSRYRNLTKEDTTVKFEITNRLRKYEIAGWRCARIQVGYGGKP
jgi:hypothetical protein